MGRNDFWGGGGVGSHVGLLWWWWEGQLGQQAALPYPHLLQTHTCLGTKTFVITAHQAHSSVQDVSRQQALPWPLPPGSSPSHSYPHFCPGTKGCVTLTHQAHPGDEGCEQAAGSVLAPATWLFPITLLPPFLPRHERLRHFQTPRS